jgi:hypothetical protein
MHNDMLFCVTETRTKEDIDYLVKVLRDFDSSHLSEARRESGEEVQA